MDRPRSPFVSGHLSHSHYLPDFCTCSSRRAAIDEHSNVASAFGHLSSIPEYLIPSNTSSPSPHRRRRKSNSYNCPISGLAHVAATMLLNCDSTPSLLKCNNVAVGRVQRRRRTQHSQAAQARIMTMEKISSRLRHDFARMND